MLNLICDHIPTQLLPHSLWCPWFFLHSNSEKDIESRGNNTPQHTSRSRPIARGAGSASIAHCFCLVYRVATTPRSYIPALNTATAPPMIKGAWRPTDPTTMNLTHLARYDAPKDTAAFSDRRVDCILFYFQTTLTHPNPDTRVHDPHRTVAAAPYCRVLTVAKSRIAEVWHRLPLSNQKDENDSKPSGKCFLAYRKAFFWTYLNSKLGRDLGQNCPRD